MYSVIKIFCLYLLLYIQAGSRDNLKCSAGGRSDGNPEKEPAADSTDTSSAFQRVTPRGGQSVSLQSVDSRAAELSYRIQLSAR